MKQSVNGPRQKFECSETRHIGKVLDDHAEQRTPSSLKMCLAAEETIREAELRLLDLLQKQAFLRSRILKLRDSGQGFRKSRESNVAFPATLAEQSHIQSAQIARPCIIRRSTKLRRACRIALCETETPETAPEIVARIVARSSYLFPEGIDAASAIVPELKRLVLQGQAYLASKNGARSWGWQRS